MFQEPRFEERGKLFEVLMWSLFEWYYYEWEIKYRYVLNIKILDNN